MSTTLTMSKKELSRISILKGLIHGTLTHVAASAALHVCERHTYRLAARFDTEGEEGLQHKLRGRSSNHRIDPTERSQVIALYRQRYADYGPTLFCEELAKRHGIVRKAETVRLWLIAEGLWARATKKRPHRKKRPRRKAIGDLLQFDGSPHDWFEGRGPACVLLHAIDDASNRTFLRFAPSENTLDVMRTMREYIERYGIPSALYVDFGAVYKDGDTETQFTRAMRDLGVEVINAHSPQAKGRVERGNRTHQDRLIKAMRQENISSIAAANAFLDRVYLQEHNDAFATIDGLADVHRGVGDRDLDKVFCILETRMVANDYTIQLNGQYIQLLRSETPLPPPHRQIDVRWFLDGSLHLSWNELELAYKRLPEKPRKRKHPAAPLPASHNWHRQNKRLKVRRQKPSRATLMTPP